MYKIQSFTPMALLALSYQMPAAFAQINPTAVESTPTPVYTYTYNPTSEATIPPYYYEYRFLYPTSQSFITIETSYKDSFNVSWEAIAPYHIPSLTITCWLRNSSGPGHSLLNLEEPAINITSPNTTYALISLEPYKDYNPCQLDLSDKQNHTLTHDNGAFTGLFNISNTSTTTGHVWSLQTPAPFYNGSSNSMSNAGCQMLAGGGGRLLWMAMLIVLLVSSLDMNVLA